MTVRALSVCERFKCLADRCPDTCCRGWHIAVDERTMERYNNLPGIFGRHIRTLVRNSNPPLYRRIFGVCPFYNSDKLCQFQQNGQEELMPLVCRQFPREVVKYMDITEIYLILSCPESARAFVSEPGRLSFFEYPKERAENTEIFWDIPNEDRDFLDFLFEEREKLLDIIWHEKKTDLSEIFRNMYAYIRNQHDPLMNNDREAMRAVSYTTDKDDQGRYAIYGEPSFAFYRIKTIDRMVINHIDYGYLMIREPKLYYFVKRYLKLFSNMTVDEADRQFDRRVRFLMEKYPEYELRYRSYFSYLIQTLYPQAFESFFILRQFLFSVLYVELLMLFDLLEFEEKGKPAEADRMAEILMILERGVRHNPALTDNLLSVIREEFL